MTTRIIRDENRGVVVVRRNSRVNTIVRERVPVKVVSAGPAGRPGAPGEPGEQGEAGPPGQTEGSTVNVTAGATIHGRRVVRIEDGEAFHPDIDIVAHATQVLGISTTAAMTGIVFSVRTAGPLEDSGWTWAPGYVYCGADGVLTQSVPATGWVQRVGRVITATSLDVDIDTPFIRTP